MLFIGIGWNVRQVVRLTPEVRWAETFQQSRTRLAALPPPVLLAPMASMLSQRGKGADGQDRFTLSAPTMRSLLDSLASRLDESRELSRYMTGLLIFLGLLGTFWGLLLTVSSVGGRHQRHERSGRATSTAMFEQLKSGPGQTAAGHGHRVLVSSMLGLAGRARARLPRSSPPGRRKTRFYNELEEWLAGLTRLSSGVLGDEMGDAAASPPTCRRCWNRRRRTWRACSALSSRGEDGRRAERTQAVLALTERIAHAGRLDARPTSS